MDEQRTKSFLYKLFGMQRMFFECVRGRMGNSQLHPKQGPILSSLLHNCGISQAELVRKMKVSAATVAVSMARLEKMGYITRERNESNQRANVLTLTQEGREEAIRLEKLMGDVAGTALKGLSGKDIEAMEKCVQKITLNLQEKYHCKECKQKHETHD